MCYGVNPVDDHVEIVHNELHCPLCDAIERISMLEKEIVFLEQKEAE